MAREGATGYTELEDQIYIKKNEEKIKELEGQLSALRGHNKVLEEEHILLNENLTEKDVLIDSLKRNIKAFEHSEDQLCIGQLCTSIQENMCEIVLEDYYDEKWNKNTKYMEDYITIQIENKAEQETARERWKLLKKEMNWNPYLIRTLGPLRRERNEVAHPPLTEESIKNAKLKMEKEGRLSKNMAKAVDTLKKMWKLSNSKLQK
jgi:hypothetical protein